MYLDSAIIVKLLVREDDSAWFDREVKGHDLWSSELALAEVRSAILAKERFKLVSMNQRKAAFARFQVFQENDDLRLHPLNSAVVQHASGLLVSCHPEIPLRSLDAIHLATAMLYPCGALCTTDNKLRAAAKRMGAPYFPEDISEIIKD
jgi:predicted nucleic acid-binding protein